MAWRGEVEDGTGWGGLVASKSEQRAEAAQAALEKDAARYRWLKHNPQWLGWEHDFRPDEVDREIDAAMTAAQSVGAA